MTAEHIKNCRTFLLDDTSAKKDAFGLKQRIVRETPPKWREIFTT